MQKLHSAISFNLTSVLLHNATKSLYAYCTIANCTKEVQLICATFKKKSLDIYLRKVYNEYRKTKERGNQNGIRRTGKGNNKIW